MSVLFAGGENSEFGLLDGAAVTTAGKFRATYARGALTSLATNGIIHNFSGALSDYIAAQGTAVDFWYGFQFIGTGGFTSGHDIFAFSNAGVGFYRIYATGTGNAVAQTSPDGSTWTGDAASDILQPTAVTEWTFRIKRHASSGCFQWWIGGTLWHEFTGDTTGFFTTCTRAAWGTAGSNRTAAFSEVIATSADDARVGLNCATLYYIGDGNDTDWVDGDYSDVAELSEDTSTVLTSTVNGDESSFLHTDVPAVLTPGLVIRAVIVSGKWRTAAGALQNLKGYLRISGTNYNNADTPSDEQAVPSVAGLLQYIWHLSPATGLAFTEAEVNALEPGMESVT